jgi:hypothetical protein
MLPARPEDCLAGLRYGLKVAPLSGTVLLGQQVGSYSGRPARRQDLSYEPLARPRPPEGKRGVMRFLAWGDQEGLAPRVS